MADEIKPEDITKKVTAAKHRTQDLRDRMEKDFDLLTLERYKVDPKEGEFESYTTNSPSVLSNKVTELLTSADLIFRIPLGDDDEKERRKISYTERFAYGGVARANEWILRDPHNPPLQDQLAWYVTNRGWIVLRFIFRKDGEEIIPDLAVWDPLNTYWGLGKKGTKWACYVRQASKEQIDDEYGIKSKEDNQGRVSVYDYWDETDEWVVINDKPVHHFKHKQGKPPVLIIPSGGMPLIQSSKHDNTIKHLGESVFVSDRDLYPVRSKMMSYYMTVVATGTKVPSVVYYKGVKPKDFESSPYTKGKVIYLSVDKGEKVEEFFKPTMPQDAMAAFSMVNGEISIGGLAPIMYGEINQQMPASGMALLQHAGMSILYPRQKCMERAYSWLANEEVRQYKENGDLGEMELEGLDTAKRLFSMKFNKDKLIDDRHIIATLKPSLPKDELQNMGMAVQGTQAGLLSPETAQDKYLGVPDTDLENQKIARAATQSLPRIRLRAMAAAAAKDGNVEAFNIIMDELDAMNTEGQAPQEKGVASQEGTPRGVVPSSLVRPGGEEVPPEVRQAAQENMRLRMMGQVRG